jgi:hypothetical protein
MQVSDRLLRQAPKLFRPRRALAQYRDERFGARQKLLKAWRFAALMSRSLRHCDPLADGPACPSLLGAPELGEPVYCECGIGRQEARMRSQEDDRMLKKLGLVIGLTWLAVGLSTPAQAQGGVRIGTLTCNVASGWGFVFGSSKGLRCTLSPGPGLPEYYAGTINKFGVDIGYTQGGVLVWAVFAPTANPGPGALNGNYVGATGSATVGVGVGANVLVGGSNSTISLQPLSIEGNTGLNVAAGIGSITLRHQPQTARRRH